MAMFYDNIIELGILVCICIICIFLNNVINENTIDRPGFGFDVFKINLWLDILKKIYSNNRCRTRENYLS